MRGRGAGSGVRLATLAAYRQDVDRYLRPRLGTVKLSDLTTGGIETKLIRAMAANGLASRTIRRAMVPLSRSLRRAVRHGQLRANPASEVEWSEVLPEGEERPKPTFSERELHALAKAAPTDEARAFLGLMAGTGIRIGEALAIRRGDLSETTVAIARTVTRGSTGPPKTKAGERVVPILPEFREHLRAARLLAAGRDPEALVFPNPLGEPREPRRRTTGLAPPGTRCGGPPPNRMARAPSILFADAP